MIIHKTSPGRNVAASFVDGFRELGTKDLAGRVARAMDAMGIVSTIPASQLVPILPGRTMIGPAFTIRNLPERAVPYRLWREGARSLMGEREAYFSMQEGDVVVIDGTSVFPASCLGSSSVTVAGRLGAAGAVVAGAVTGVPGIRAAGYPVWARAGTTVTGHHRLETVEVNGVLGIDGVRIEAGDLVVADDSGVTIVPSDCVESALALIRRMMAGSDDVRRELASDLDRERLHGALEKQASALASVAADH